MTAEMLHRVDVVLTQVDTLFHLSGSELHRQSRAHTKQERKSSQSHDNTVSGANPETDGDIYLFDDQY